MILERGLSSKGTYLKGYFYLKADNTKIWYLTTTLFPTNLSDIASSYTLYKTDEAEHSVA